MRVSGAELQNITSNYTQILVISMALESYHYHPLINSLLLNINWPQQEAFYQRFSEAQWRISEADSLVMRQPLV